MPAPAPPEAPAAPPLDPARVAYLAQLAAVVGRMSSFGSLVKGWGITLLAGLFVISRPGARIEIGVVLVAALVLLWLLDRRVFRIEKTFRARYEAVRTGRAPADHAMEPRLFGEESAPTPGRRRFLEKFWIGLIALATLGAVILRWIVDHEVS